MSVLTAMLNALTEMPNMWVVYFPQQNGTSGTVCDWLMSERGRVIGQ